MASIIELQQDSLEFGSNASISAHPKQKKESVWTQQGQGWHIIYCVWPARDVKGASAETLLGEREDGPAQGFSTMPQDGRQVGLLWQEDRQWRWKKNIF